MLTKSSPRFGAFSHQSFFSRHNPHPIPGLNGRPVCMVRDDWFVTSSLFLIFPHPLLKSHVLRKATNPSSEFRLPENIYGVSSNKNKSAQFSEAWRDELKDLAAKVSLSPQAQKDRKDARPEEECVRRKTQYSAETGIIIPPSTKSYQRRANSQRLPCPQALHDQELMVFEHLCQILQTDSLSTVQQWLLLISIYQKDLVMGMIKQAVDGVNVGNHQPEAFHPASPSLYGTSFDQSWKHHRERERIGDAEVLEIHAGAQNDLQNHPLQSYRVL
ncbi:LOW QUALITY PROTEIN: protein TBATA [Lycodopsis pacificus]